MLTRLLEHVVDLVLTESQCGCRRGRSTINMIFVARQLQEKCREQYQGLYLAIVDLTKAFDAVNRDLLWNIRRTTTIIAILQIFHAGMCAQVVTAGSQSSSFPVEMGMKQGSVLAPIIFNLLLVATALVSNRDLQSSDRVEIDGGLFNLRRLQTKIETSSAMFSALQYADDAAFTSPTADGLQRSLDVMSETYLCAGLWSIQQKQKILVHHHLMPQLFPLVGISLQTLKILPTWAQISHFLVTLHMRSKDALILLHHSFAV